ncbi:methionyl-tRNA formyltransferase [Verrucomicrobiota bacterium]|nr:methionyl-tRNA formyltransferase [Verrucomicrobiota bacterium]
MRHRLVLLGSDEIALAAFIAARALPAVDVVAVYSQPDRPSGRGQEVRPNPVAAWARQEGLPLLQPERLSAEDAAYLQSLDVSLGVVMAYGQILKDDFLQAPRLGLVNFHGSLLPALRGATPVEGALAAGLDVTGISLQQVVRKLDAGPLHASAALTIAHMKAAQPCVPAWATSRGNWRPAPCPQSWRALPSLYRRTKRKSVTPVA